MPDGQYPVPVVTSPAMKLLLAAVERECSNELIPAARKYLSAARIYMAALERLVNSSATMSEGQAATLADYIVDKWLPKHPDYTDVLGPRMSMAMYINSCRA